MGFTTGRMLAALRLAAEKREIPLSRCRTADIGTGHRAETR